MGGEKGQVYQQTSAKQTVFLCVFKPSQPTETSNSGCLPENASQFVRRLLSFVLLPILSVFLPEIRQRRFCFTQ